MSFEEEIELHRWEKERHFWGEGRDKANTSPLLSLVSASSSSSLTPCLLTHHGSPVAVYLRIHSPLQAAASLPGQVRVWYSPCDSPSPHALTLPVNTWFPESSTSLSTIWALENSIRRDISYAGDSAKSQGCPAFWHLWATLEEGGLSWATH